MVGWSVVTQVKCGRVVGLIKMPLSMGLDWTEAALC